MSDNNNPAEIVQQVQEAWTEFKATNDANLASRDAVLEEKLERINNSLNSLNDAQTRAAAGPIVSTTASEADAGELNAQLRSYIFQGVMSRAVTTTVGANAGEIGAAGGYAVPREFDRDIVQKVVNVSPLLGGVTVKQTGTPDIKVHANLRGTTSAWVTETGTDGMYDVTNTPKLAELSVPFGKLFAKPLIGQDAENDMYFDAEAWVMENLSQEFAYQVNNAILNGSGVGQPKGILGYTTAATGDRSRAFGTIQHTITGAAAALPADFNRYIDLQQSLNAFYAPRAKWVANRATIGELRKVKDGDGRYMWESSVQVGQANRFFGAPVIEAEDMPAIGAGALPLVYGDLTEYRLYDLVGMSLLRDPYSYDAFIALKAAKRFGGLLPNSDAIKVLKVSAS